MIKSWMFEQLNISCDADPAYFDVVACSKEYAWRSELWAQLETLGFHGIFFSEHHFSGLRASPSPGVLAAWVAACSQNLRIGVLGWVLPLWQPWRFLEEVAVLDQLSQGRVEIGVARGSSVDEAAAVGIAEVDIVPMYREALDILEQAWLSPYLSHCGRYWSFEQLGMVPRPLQYPSPPIWTTVRSTDAAAEAAKRGHRLCTGFLHTDAIVRLFDVYREATVHMHTAERLAIRRCIFVAKTEAQAHEHARAAQAQMPSIVDDDIIAGTPTQVTEQILFQLGRTGAANIVGFFAGHRCDPGAVRTSCDLFGEYVIPALQSASI